MSKRMVRLVMLTFGAALAVAPSAGASHEGTCDIPCLGIGTGVGVACGTIAGADKLAENNFGALGGSGYYPGQTTVRILFGETCVREGAVYEVALAAAHRADGPYLCAVSAMGLSIHVDETLSALTEVPPIGLIGHVVGEVEAPVEYCRHVLME